MSIKKFYASDYMTLDSNVILGGGTDVTDAMQALLDFAKDGASVHIVLDGAALVRGLKIFSNTTVECPNKSCGFYLADFANRPIIANADWNFLGEKPTKNVSLIGGTYNHNCTHQKHDVPYDEYPTPPTIGHNEDFATKHLIYLMEFYGVENLTIRDLTFRNQRTYTLLVGNFKNVKVEGCNIEMADYVRPSNQDGLHFWGPGQYLTIRDFRACTGDDVINIGPDEIDYVSDITDVLVDGVFLDDCCQGIRLLSKGSGSLDRVTIRNVTGTYRTFAFGINPCITEKSFGNFGDICLENISLKQIKETFLHTPLKYMQVGGNIRCLSMKNVRFINPIRNSTFMELGRPFFYRPMELTMEECEEYKKLGIDIAPSPDDKDVFLTEDRPTIETLIIDGFTVLHNNAEAAKMDYIELRYNVNNLIVKNTEILKGGVEEPCGSLVRLHYEANVGNLILENVFAEKLENVLKAGEGHKVKLLKATNVTLSGGKKILDIDNASIDACLQSNLYFVE